MEPRSFDRGDAIATERVYTGFASLQWSRGLLTAETGTQTAASWFSQSLQWSRGLLTAETGKLAFGRDYDL